ncbi:PREDICTED: translation initiation factor IF-2-like [Capra hircus]|uniref:translation initiation factor IF-2-like n=1 Tax=Capra hircus TaxID=9925 RepID=UPI0008474777|nr:PREDICTED: translation initiation factor IF-2-like [Capra hircus]
MRTSRRLGPRPGSGYDPWAARPAAARGCAHARRHLGPSTGQECGPRAPRPGLAGGLAHAQRRLSKRPRAGLSPQGLLSQLPRPEARTTSAQPPGSPLLLGRGTGATTSWRLPQKQPGLGGMRPDARSPREEEGSEPEGRGGGRATAPRPSSPLPPCRPRPLSRL